MIEIQLDPATEKALAEMPESDFRAAVKAMEERLRPPAVRPGEAGRAEAARRTNRRRPPAVRPGEAGRAEAARRTNRRRR